mmetsp:Transcript_132521/g.247840  ORF Transcript_132521/g.247840 Transcript_132521/m.247840 type:complete len:615 (-) Transcript_132521:68-1912(-)
MPSSDVVREMRTIARFEELARMPLLAKILTFCRLPGSCERLGMSRSCSDGQLLRALADQKSPSNVLRNFGVDVSTAVKAEANLQLIVDSTAKPFTTQSQRLENREANWELLRACCRYCVVAALLFAAVLLLASLSLLGVGLWKELKDWDLHFMDQTIEAEHFFIASIGTGSLAILIVTARVMAICCEGRCGCCQRACARCCRCIRDCCLCRCRCGRRQVADEEEEDAKPELSALQVSALRRITQRQLTGQLSPEHSDHISRHLSEHLALANSPYQSPEARQTNAGESQLALWGADAIGSPAHAISPHNGRLDGLTLYNSDALAMVRSPSLGSTIHSGFHTDALAMVHSPSLGSTIHSGFKSVSFEEPEPSDTGTTVVTASPKAVAINDPGNYAWHHPQTHSFAAKFMGLYAQPEPSPSDANLTEEERFKIMAEKMRKKPAQKVTFPGYADDVVGNPVAEMETFRETSRQFYIDTMFQSTPVYPDYHPDSEKSRKEQDQLRAMAAAPVADTKPPEATEAKPFQLQRPVSSQSLSSAMMMRPGRLERSTGAGNALGLTSPAAVFRVGTSDPPMLSPASTTSNGRFMMGAASRGQFPYRPEPRTDEAEDCLRRAAIA